MSQSKTTKSRIGQCYELLLELDKSRRKAVEEGRELPHVLTIAGREIKIDIETKTATLAESLIPNE